LIGVPANSCRIPPEAFDSILRVGQGGEHTVYRHKEFGKAKVTRPDDYGHSVYGEGVRATLIEYLFRLSLHNSLFGDDFRIAGLIVADDHLQIVTTQPWVIAHEFRPVPDLEEITRYFGDLGFRPVNLGWDVPDLIQPTNNSIKGVSLKRAILLKNAAFLDANFHFVSDFEFTLLFDPEKNPVWKGRDRAFMKTEEVVRAGFQEFLERISDAKLEVPFSHWFSKVS
jgi:hypothetical protein